MLFAENGLKMTKISSNDVATTMLLIG